MLLLYGGIDHSNVVCIQYSSLLTFKYTILRCIHLLQFVDLYMAERERERERKREREMETEWGKRVS